MAKKEMGEFEARPEMKPAVAVPIERKKPTGLICSVVILAILVAGLAGYIVFDLTSRSNSRNQEKCVSEKTSDGQKQQQEGENPAVEIPIKEPKDNPEDEVKDIISDVKMAAKGFLVGYSYTLKDTQNEVLSYKIDDNYATSLEKSYGISLLGASDDGSSEVIEGDEFGEIIRKVMKVHNLEKTEYEDNMTAFFGAPEYYTNENGYICSYNLASSPWTINCGYSGWLSEDKKQLVKQLVDEYKAEEEWFKENEVKEAIWLNASNKNIKNSINSPYQTLQGTVANAAIIFYRKGPSDKWHYVGSTQQGLDCAWFDTADKKAAFEGQRCIDIKNNKDSTVKR